MPRSFEYPTCGLGYIDGHARQASHFEHERAEKRQLRESACVARSTVLIIGRVSPQNSRGLSTAAPRPSRSGRPDRADDRPAATPVGAEQDDFASFVNLRLVDDDYAILRKFQNPQHALDLSGGGDRAACRSISARRSGGAGVRRPWRSGSARSRSCSSGSSRATPTPSKRRWRSCAPITSVALTLRGAARHLGSAAVARDARPKLAKKRPRRSVPTTPPKTSSKMPTGNGPSSDSNAHCRQRSADLAAQDRVMIALRFDQDLSMVEIAKLRRQFRADTSPAPRQKREATPAALSHAGLRSA